MNNDSALESSSAMNSHILKKFKIVFLGDQGVGKTSIIKQFILNSFDENNSVILATIGVDLISKNITVDNKAIRLNLWDTAGQERFRCLIPGYIRDSNVAIIVYDITRRETFNSLQGWINEVKTQREDDVCIAVIGCKNDLEAKRDVSTQEGLQFAEEHKAIFCEVSAKTGNNIKKMFEQVVSQLLGGMGNSQIQVPSITETKDANPNAGQKGVNNDDATQNSSVIKENKQGGGCCS